MSNILPFPLKEAGAARPGGADNAPPNRREAVVLIFTGVRYRREEPARGSKRRPRQAKMEG